MMLLQWWKKPFLSTQSVYMIIIIEFIYLFIAPYSIITYDLLSVFH